MKAGLDCTRVTLYRRLVGDLVIEGVLHVAINMPLYDGITRWFQARNPDPHAKPTILQTIIASNVAKSNQFFLTQPVPA